MKNLIILTLVTFIAISCKSDNDPLNSETTQASRSTSQDPLVINTMKLLQGTWNSRDEKNVSITFKDNTRVEKRDGNTLGKMRYFQIADQCNNATVKNEKIVRVRSRFISMLDIDMCYFIKRISKKELVLTYMGRKGDLRYVKEHTPSK